MPLTGRIWQRGQGVCGHTTLSLMTLWCLSHCVSVSCRWEEAGDPLGESHPGGTGGGLCLLRGACSLQPARNGSIQSYKPRGLNCADSPRRLGRDPSPVKFPTRTQPSHHAEQRSQRNQAPSRPTETASSYARRTSLSVCGNSHAATVLLFRVQSHTKYQYLRNTIQPFCR